MTHCPNAVASEIAVRPPMTAPRASMSAPASSSASRAATSSLLAAQCSGVSVCGPVNLASTSAPALTSAWMVAATLGKCPPIGGDVQQATGHAAITELVDVTAEANRRQFWVCCQ